MQLSNFIWIIFAAFELFSKVGCRSVKKSSIHSTDPVHLHRSRRTIEDLTEPRAWKSSRSGVVRLKYTLVNMPSHTTLSYQTVREEIAQAMAVWSCYSNVFFEEVARENFPDIFISFEKGTHGYFNFFSKKRVPYQCHMLDGRGGHLAHAFTPRGRTAYDEMGNLHFDDDEKWSEDTEPGNSFFYIAVHEIGHVLGLSHTHEPNNVMYTYINQSLWNEEIDLGAWDRKELRHRYGWRHDCSRKSWQEYFRGKRLRENYKDLNTRFYRTRKRSTDFRSDCRDEANVCQNYSPLMCRRMDRVGDWLKKYCKRMCRTCNSSPIAPFYRTQHRYRRGCSDSYTACWQYPKEMCFARHHRRWMMKNCRRWCGSCDLKM